MDEAIVRDLASLVVHWRRQTGIAGNKLVCAGGTTTQHFTSCTVTYPAETTSTKTTHSLLQGRIVLQMSTDGFTHHGVFAHQYHSFVPKGKANGLHLLGADIVCTHNEAFWIIIQKFLKRKKGNILKSRREGTKVKFNLTYTPRTNATYDDFQKVVGLPRGPVFPGHLCSASKDRLRAGLKTRLYLISNKKIRVTVSVSIPTWSKQRCWRANVIGPEQASVSRPR